MRFSEAYTGSDDVATLARLSIYGESEGGAATVTPFRTRERPPGERFSYASAETQVLGLVLRAATGKPLADYLSEKIWQPMGAEADATWLVDKGGYEIGFSGLNATLRDYGRFGMLLANDGRLDGRQLIPAAWVRAATTPPAKQFEPGQTGFLLGYGYQTWILPGKERQFVLRGLRGQVVLRGPEVEAGAGQHLGGQPQRGHGGGAFALVRRRGSSRTTGRGTALRAPDKLMKGQDDPPDVACCRKVGGIRSSGCAGVH